MSVLKRFNSSDQPIYPVKKEVTITRSISGFPRLCAENTSGVTILTGKNVDGDFNKDTDPVSEGYYQRHLYLYYKNLHDKSFPNTFFPTNINDTIRIVRLDSDLVGGKLSKNTFVWGLDIFTLYDKDGLLMVGTDVVGFIDYSKNSLIITSASIQLISPIPVTISNTTVDQQTSLNFDLSTITSKESGVQSYQIVGDSNGFSISGNTLIHSNSDFGTKVVQIKAIDTYGICSNTSTFSLTRKASCDSNVDIQPFSESVVNGSCVVYIDSIEAPACANSAQYITVSPEKYTIDTINEPTGIVNVDLPFVSNLVGNWKISSNNGISFDSLINNSNRVSVPINPTNSYYLFILRFETANGSYEDLLVDVDPYTGQSTSKVITKKTDLRELPQGCFPNQYKVSSPGATINSVVWSYTGDINGIPISNDTVAIVGSRGSLQAVVNTSNGTCSKTIQISGDKNTNGCDSSVSIKVYRSKIPNEFFLKSYFSDYYSTSYPEWSIITGGYEIVNSWNTNFIRIRFLDVTDNNIVRHRVKNFCGTYVSVDTTISYSKPVVYPSTTLPPNTTSTSTSTTTKDPVLNLKLTDLELKITTSTPEVKLGGRATISITVYNNSNVSAHNVIIESILPNQSSFYQLKSNQIISVFDKSVQFAVDEILPGDSEICIFTIDSTAPVGSVLEVSAQVKSVDEDDIDSIAGQILGEDDEGIVSFKIINELATTSTSTPCKPFIRPNPYTGYECSDETQPTGLPKRGKLIISAINPFTNDSTGLEYSFSGDVETNYVDSEKSPFVNDGIYTIWVRVKKSPLCKTSTQIRVRCNVPPTQSWNLLGSNCYLTDKDEAEDTSYKCNVRVYDVALVGVTDGTNKSFTIPQKFALNTLIIHKNDYLLRETRDYTVSGTTVTLIVAPESNASLIASYEVL